MMLGHPELVPAQLFAKHRGFHARTIEFLHRPCVLREPADTDRQAYLHAEVSSPSSPSSAAITTHVGGCGRPPSAPPNGHRAVCVGAAWSPSCASAGATVYGCMVAWERFTIHAPCHMRPSPTACTTTSGRSWCREGLCYPASIDGSCLADTPRHIWDPPGRRSRP